MNRPRLIKGLKIAWTAFWSVVAVSLIVLWVRSYGIIDDVSRGRFEVASQSGILTIAICDKPLVNQFLFVSLKRPPDLQAQHLSQWFSAKREPVAWYVRIPLWFPVLLSALMALVFTPFWSNRFSLRTLLIITTLVAIVLGLIVWAR